MHGWPTFTLPRHRQLEEGREITKLLLISQGHFCQFSVIFSTSCFDPVVNIQVRQRNNILTFFVFFPKRSRWLDNINLLRFLQLIEIFPHCIDQELLICNISK